MAKPYKHPNRNSWLRVKLRRLSLQWPAASEALRLARVDRGIFKCANCNKRFKRDQVHRDHKEPVVPLTGQNMQPDGEVDWNNYLKRLLVKPEEYQILCVNCHEVKSSLESNMRDYYKKEKKSKTKKKKEKNV